MMRFTARLELFITPFNIPFIIFIFIFIFFIAVISNFSINSALAYPNFIGMGYSSCMICHYNPTGNGPLTDYGRAVSATAISGRAFVSDKTTDENLANYSGFFFNAPSATSNLRPSFTTRWIHYRQNIGKVSKKNENIFMQASAQLVWNGGENKKWIITGDIGYAPDPRAAGQEKEKNYRSREHYVGYRINSNWGVYAGLMDKPYGIKIPEHYAYARTQTGNTMNDQVHGAMIHYVSKKMETAVQYYLGNFAQKSSLRQKGISGIYEYAVNDQLRIGASALSSQSDYLKRFSYAFHWRQGFGHGGSVLAEYGFVTKNPVAGNSTKSRYGLLQGYLPLTRGLYWINTFEYSLPNADAKDYSVRLGPSLQYFPGQRVELRLDLLTTRYYQDNGVTDDALSLIGQIHLWF